MTKSKWKDTQSSEEIIKRISNLQLKPEATSNAIYTHRDHHSSFINNGFKTLIILLKDQTRFSTEIPEHQKDQIIIKAIFESADNEKLTCGYISETIKRMEHEYLSKENTTFILLTRITIHSLAKNISVKTPNASISISQKIPKKFKRHYDFKKAESLHPNTDENAYSWVTIKTQSRCIHSAANNALQELNFFIGILNIFYNYNQGSRVSFSTPQPINKLRLFPYHSLHLTSGQQATDAHWYNLSNSMNGSSTQADEKLHSAISFFRKTKNKILKTNQYHFFLNALNRYNDALETNDMNKSFLSLWSLLEHITFTGKDSYDVTINRAIFIFKDKFITRHTLELLRSKRNMAIHTGETFDEAEKYTYMLLAAC